MKVAIIGGGGRMGSWFALHFSSRGTTTVLSDLNIDKARSVASRTGAETAESSISAVADADLALICVPIDDTPGVIHEIAPHMKSGAVLAELSSVKAQTVKALREVASLGVQPLSLHPMFGPAATSLKKKTIVVVQVLDGNMEADITSSLFEEAEIVISEQEEHDRVMAALLSLTYFLNIAFAKVISEEDLTSMKRMAGTTFTVQLTIAEAVISEDPVLVASLLRENTFTEYYLNRFATEAGKISELVKCNSKGLLDLYNFVRARFSQDPDYALADERRNRAFEALKE